MFTSRWRMGPKPNRPKYLYFGGLVPGITSHIKDKSPVLWEPHRLAATYQTP